MKKIERKSKIFIVYLMIVNVSILVTNTIRYYKYTLKDNDGPVYSIIAAIALFAMLPIL